MVWRAGLCFFWHLLAEIFAAISLCSFGRGRLKENHLSVVTGRGLDRSYIYIYSYCIILGWQWSYLVPYT